MSVVEDHIRAIEKKMGTSGDELELSEWLDIRLRLASLRLKLEQRDTLVGLLAELKPVIARSLGGGDASLNQPDPNRERARELLRRMGDELEDERDNVDAIAEALDQAEARGHDLAKFPGMTLG